ncbi:MAG: hypothetical protein GXY32_11550 [Ruminococcaceae bacterium]|nr:hypothetical protein [Oscillospiraceae bacterium]
MSEAEAYDAGWVPILGNFFLVAPGKMLSKGVFENRKGKLPSTPGRIWYEADINYTIGYRNGHRILFPNDGLLFVTYDHYITFKEIV